MDMLIATLSGVLLCIVDDANLKYTTESMVTTIHMGVDGSFRSN